MSDFDSGEESEYSYDSDLVHEVYRDAQKEWEESMIQLTTLLNFVLIPIIGRVIGRRFANSLWARIANKIWN
ncbi:Hypothetical protein PP7435_CHR2-2661 [Komagataella phaffii CBS 7435]|uniref:Uncharacterized protein n=1 Tax=Komagataella phaffii (strain ATCC 76273 / CBS 7435 / CECT 11047 / NRRL Y-11430 / Wegner 21-1) TaxID=981350 RepID=A0A1G4KQ34_KOMPC|nr:Hypothetical protein BQ9382_C2-6555 [Komagataella phaffii CBS 7435]SCV12121.1 Hypothetical protein PP7435_CHR2-2661 [Komagataella phaffii CBS 7435]